MLISHKYKFVFVHVPKCAGHTARRALWPFCEEPTEAMGWRWDAITERFVDAPHVPLLELEQWPEIQAVKGYYWFAFVRDPYSRFLSGLSEHWAQNLLSDDIDPVAYANALDPLRLRLDLTFTHLCPMHYFTHVGLKRRVDEVYYVENFAAEFRRLAVNIGLPVSAFAPDYKAEYRREDSSNKRDFGTYADQLTEAVNRIYRRDFELFRYPMRVADQAPAAAQTFQWTPGQTTPPRLDLADIIRGSDGSRWVARVDAVADLLDENAALKRRVAELEASAANQTDGEPCRRLPS